MNILYIFIDIFELCITEHTVCVRMYSPVYMQIPNELCDWIISIIFSCNIGITLS